MLSIVVLPCAPALKLSLHFDWNGKVACPSKHTINLFETVTNKQANAGPTVKIVTAFWKGCLPSKHTMDFKDRHKQTGRWQPQILPTAEWPLRELLLSDDRPALRCALCSSAHHMARVAAPAT